MSLPSTFARAVAGPTQGSPEAAGTSGSPRRGSAPKWFSGRRRTAILLVALTLAVYLPGFTWGIPDATSHERMHAWGNDDLIPLRPLSEMYNTFVRDDPNRNIAYPWFHYALVAGAYAPYMAVVYAQGGFEQPTGEYPFGLTQPRDTFRSLTLIGRAVSIALAVACVIAVWVAGTALAGSVGGIAAAVTTVFLYPMAYYAKLGNPDVPVLAWTAIGIAAAARIVMDGATMRRSVVLGVALALAGATKDQSAGSFFLLLPAVLALHLAREGVRLRAWRAPAAMLLAFLPTYIVASGIPVDLDRYIRHLRLLFAVGAEGVLYLRYPSTLTGYRMHLEDLARLLPEVMGWPLLLLAVAGIVIAAQHDRRRLLFLLPALGFLLILVPVRFSRIHYMLPIALPLTFFVGIAVNAAWQRGAHWRWGAGGALGLALLSPALWTADLTHAMRNDSRYDAADFLAAHVRPGDAMLQFAAPTKALPYLPAALRVISVEYRADARPVLEAERPPIVYVQTVDTNEDRHRVEWRDGPHSVYSDYLTADVYRGLADGSLGYRLVAQFQTPRLLPWVRRPFLSYPSVNPPIQIFLREDRAGNLPRLRAWETAPHNPRVRWQDRLTVEAVAAGSLDDGRP